MASKNISQCASAKPTMKLCFAEKSVALKNMVNTNNFIPSLAFWRRFIATSFLQTKIGLLWYRYKNY